SPQAPSWRRGRMCWARTTNASLRFSSQRLGEPVGYIVAGVRHVVGADMLDPAFARRKYLELAARGVGELVIGLLRVIHADLPVGLATGDEEWLADAVHMPVKVHLLGLGEEILHVLRPEGPEH